jgi:hypothetical protein
LESFLLKTDAFFAQERGRLI